MRLNSVSQSSLRHTFLASVFGVVAYFNGCCCCCCRCRCRCFSFTVCTIYFSFLFYCALCIAQSAQDSLDGCYWYVCMKHFSTLYQFICTYENGENSLCLTLSMSGCIFVLLNIYYKTYVCASKEFFSNFYRLMGLNFVYESVI